MRKGSPSTTSVALSAKGAKSAKSAGRSSSCKARPVYFAVSDEPADRPTAMMAYNGNFSRVPPPTGLDPPPVPTVAGRRGTSYFVFPAELDGAQGGATVDEHTGALRSELFVPGGVFFLELLYGDFGSSNPAGRGRGRGKSDRRMADSHCSCNGGVGSVAGTSTRSWSMVEAVDPDSQMLMEALRASSDVVIEQMLESARQMDVSEPTGEPVLSQGPMPLEDQAAGTAASGQQPAVPLEPAPTEQPEAAAPPSGISSPWSPTQPSTPRSQAEPKTAAPQCKHERTTTKGTNQYFYLKTCKNCGLVLEKTRKEAEAQQPKASSGAGARYAKKPEDCKRERVTRQGTNHHVWRWFCKG